MSATNKQREKYYERKAAGICTSCGINKSKGSGVYCQECINIRSPRGKKWNQDNKERVNELSRIRIAKVKKEVYAAYGNACACCGEQYEHYLELDHINNDGYLQRTKVKTGSHTYLWLKRNNYPTDIQLLCGNCHAAKTRNKPCNH